jgi:hypothetical protein
MIADPSHSVADLLDDCRSRGILMSSTSGTDELSLDAPRGALTPDLVARLKHFKAELIETLRRSATNRLPEQPTPQGKLVDPEVSVKSSLRVCTRCGGTEYREVPIHEGRSIRHDCANCGRFLEFSEWYKLDALHFEK